jgi:hypothetical protein
MNPLRFWAEPHRWPRDPAGYVFLARAVEEIGRAMFDARWTGKEVTTDFVRPLPDLYRAALQRAGAVKTRNRETI